MMITRSKSLLLLLFIYIFSLSSTQLKADSSKEVVKFGLAVCLSGPCALGGQNAINGATLAANDLNEKGGILGRKIEFVVEDTQDGITGAKAVTAFYSLRRNKDIHFFIGPSWTPGLLALAPIVSRDSQVVMMTHDGGVKEFHLAGKNLFNSRGVDETSTRELAKLAYKMGARTAAIFGSQQAWELDQGRFFEEEFTKSGGIIVAKVEPIPTMGDFNAEALKVISKKPDVILFSAYTQLDLALKALGSLNYKGKKIMAFIDDSRIRLAGSAIEGGITYESLNLSNTFTDRLKKAYPSTEPFWTAYTGYDSVMAYAKAITAAKSFDPKVVAEELTKISLDDAVSGEFSFDGGRLAVRKTTNYVVVKNGKLVVFVPEVDKKPN